MKKKCTQAREISPRDRLLTLLGPLVTRDMLLEIAAADYGADQEKHFAAVFAIHATAHIPSPLPWEPKEVLELMRWSEPDDPVWRPGGKGLRGHIIRAWCCAVLLRAGCDAESQPYFIGHADTLVQLILSLERISLDVTDAASDLVIALLESEAESLPYSGEMVLLQSGLIFLLCAEASPRAELIANALDRLAQSAIVEQNSQGQTAPCLPNFQHACVKHDAWRKLADQLRGEKRGNLDAEFASQVKAHAELLFDTLAGVVGAR